METLRSIVSLADLLCRQGKLFEAEEVVSRVLQDAERTLRSDHPITLECLANFGQLRYLQKRYKESILLYKQALTGRKMILGSEHPLTLNCQERWSEIAAKLKEMNEFEDRFEILVEGSDEETDWKTADEWKV